MHIHKYEKAWLVLGVITVCCFATAVAVAGFAWGFQVPQPSGKVDSRTLDTHPQFGKPGLRELAPGKYECYLTAKASPWAFEPQNIEIPVGSTVTFFITSHDVEHGFNIQGTNVNLMVLPNHVSKLTKKFEAAGEVHYVCNEYCGVGHQNMFGTLKIIGGGTK
jgi:cytochrome c oxidase subunit 2